MAITVEHLGGTHTSEAIPRQVMRLLPASLCRELTAWEAQHREAVEELRLRRGRQGALTLPGRTVRLSYIMSGREMDEVVRCLCDGSLYAHRDTIAEGYVTLTGGIRVGICGRASVQDGRVLGVYEVDGLNFRFPCRPPKVGEPICRLLCGEECRGGVLIYGPPGAGKTTLLRSVIASVASKRGSRRVAVVDTRSELAMGLSDPTLSVDILSGYPRGLGIEIATRTLNPQLIVCDELGDGREARSVLEAQHCGVPLLASAHGESVAAMLNRESMGLLHRARVFDFYVGIRRIAGMRDYQYTVTRWEDVHGMDEAAGVHGGSALRSPAGTAL